VEIKSDIQTEECKQIYKVNIK